MPGPTPPARIGKFAGGTLPPKPREPKAEKPPVQMRKPATVQVRTPPKMKLKPGMPPGLINR